MDLTFQVFSFGHQPLDITFKEPSFLGQNYYIYDSVKSLTLEKDVNVCLLNQMFQQFKNLELLDIGAVVDDDIQASVIQMIDDHNVPIKHLIMNLFEANLFDEEEEEPYINVFSRIEELSIHLTRRPKIHETFFPSVAGHLKNLKTLRITSTDPDQIRDCLSCIQDDCQRKILQVPPTYNVRYHKIVLDKSLFTISSIPRWFMEVI
jgi:hypothetical protein